MTIRAGIIGYGSIGKLNHRAIQACPGIDVVAVASTRPVADPMVRHDLEFRALLAARDIDLVVICGPSGIHASQALSALQAGKLVVVEKPLTLDSEEGARVVEEARRRDLHLSVISQRRFEDHTQHLKRTIDAGAAGRPLIAEVLLRWHRDQAYYDQGLWRGTASLDGGILMNQAIHAIDLVRWFLGPVRAASGSMATLRHDIEAPDTATAWLEFDSGALGIVMATTAAHEGSPAEVNVVLERGEASLHDERLARWTLPVPPAADDGATRGSGAADPAGITIAGHLAQWRDIVDSIETGRDPIVTGEEGLATVAVVLAIHESSRLMRPVRPSHQSTPGGPLTRPGSDVMVT